jgi:hypothetical protein
VPLSAQVPINPPTANRMKIAPMPVATLSAEALPSTSSEWPRRQPMNTAIIVAITSATWFGPTAPASPNRK